MRKKYAIQDFIGERFGFLTIIGKGERTVKIGKGVLKPRSAAVCICDCGNRTVVFMFRLISGQTRSCGCGKFVFYPKAFMRDDPQLRSFNHLFSCHKSASKERGIVQSLSFEEFKSLVVKPCFYCGAEPFEKHNVFLKKDGTLRRRRKTPLTVLDHAAWIHVNGLDRLNSDLDYKLENVVPCCKWCNYAKCTQTFENFLDWIMRIASVRRKNDKK